MLSREIELCVLLVAVAHAFRYTSTSMIRRSGWVNRMMMMTEGDAGAPEVESPTATATATPTAPTSSTKKDGKMDFSQFSVGQEYTGNLVGAKNFGVFVNINTGTNVTTYPYQCIAIINPAHALIMLYYPNPNPNLLPTSGTNVLLPRSQMSRGAYERLKRMAETKSKDTVKLALIAISAENATLSGKYVPAAPLKEVSLLQKADAGTALDATVVGAHDFGMYGFIDNTPSQYTLKHIQPTHPSYIAIRLVF